MKRAVHTKQNFRRTAEWFARIPGFREKKLAEIKNA